MVHGILSRAAELLCFRGIFGIQYWSVIRGQTWHILVMFQAAVLYVYTILP